MRTNGQFYWTEVSIVYTLETPTLCPDSIISFTCLRNDLQCLLSDVSWLATLNLSSLRFSLVVIDFVKRIMIGQYGQWCASFDTEGIAILKLSSTEVFALLWWRKGFIRKQMVCVSYTTILVFFLNRFEIAETTLQFSNSFWISLPTQVNMISRNKQSPIKCLKFLCLLKTFFLHGRCNLQLINNVFWCGKSEILYGLFLMSRWWFFHWMSIYIKMAKTVLQEFEIYYLNARFCSNLNFNSKQLQFP